MFQNTCAFFIHKPMKIPCETGMGGSASRAAEGVSDRTFITAILPNERIKTLRLRDIRGDLKRLSDYLYTPDVAVYYRARASGSEKSRNTRAEKFLESLGEYRPKAYGIVYVVENKDRPSMSLDEYRRFERRFRRAKSGDELQWPDDDDEFVVVNTQSRQGMHKEAWARMAGE